MTSKTILLDIDGVLTDGKINITQDGEKLFKSFHSRDVAAIRELVLNGYRVILVTADDHESGKYFADKVGAEYKVERDKKKLGACLIAVGDSAWDIPMLKNAKYAFTPADCYSKKYANWGIQALDTVGGCGVVAELVEFMYEKKLIGSYD